MSTAGPANLVASTSMPKCDPIDTNHNTRVTAVPCRHQDPSSARQIRTDNARMVLSAAAGAKLTTSVPTPKNLIERELSTNSTSWTIPMTPKDQHHPAAAVGLHLSRDKLPVEQQTDDRHPDQRIQQQRCIHVRLHPW